jgi:predicted S18 family serine protease
MAKSDTTDVVLGVLGVLGVATLAGAAAYAGVRQTELLIEERSRLQRALDKLEGKRIRDLTTRQLRDMQALQARIDEIDDALY